MTEQIIAKTPKAPKPATNKPTPIGRLLLPEVDLALTECEKIIKAHTDIVKAKLSSNASFPTNVLRELSRANAQKGRLMVRRIAILIESGDSAAMEIFEKLMKVKPAK